MQASRRISIVLVRRISDVCFWDLRVAVHFWRIHVSLVKSIAPVVLCTEIWAILLNLPFRSDSYMSVEQFLPKRANLDGKRG